MAIESPLFQSSMELLGHSLTHYNGKKELDRKLVILHLANAVELILKDLVLDAGESIYKGPKETITIHGCLSALDAKGVKLPFLNKIELLIDERNALQHRFGSPNQLTSIFYMNIAQAFFKEVLKKHYGLDYDEVIAQFADEQALAALRLSEPTNDQELEKLEDLANLHPLGALLSAWSYFEKKTVAFIESVGLNYGPRRPFSMELHRGRFASFGIDLPVDLKQELDAMRQTRNLAAHGHAEPTRDDVISTIKVIERLEKHLDELDKDKIRALAIEERTRFEERRAMMIRERQEELNRSRSQQGLEVGGVDN